MVEAIEASGMTPLDYMIAVMRNKDLDPQIRLEGAKGAAPYVHARLSSTELFTHPDPVTAAAISESKEEIEQKLLALLQGDPELRDKLIDESHPGR